MLHHKGTQEIRTSRLLLRAIREEDYKDMYQYTSKDEVSRYVTWNTHKNPDETKALCKMWVNQYKNKDKYHWAIVYENRVIGNIEVVKIADAAANMGWQIDSIHWNKGFVTEAATAVFDYLFNEIGFEVIESAHMEPNIASGRVMQKTGMTIIPTEKSLFYNSTCQFKGIPIISYKLTKEEWQCLNMK